MIKKRIILIGDSITEGFDTKYLPKELEAYNVGVSGDSTVETISRINSGWFNRNIDYIFICIGTNDFARQRGDKQILDNINLLVNRIKEFEDSSKIILTSIFPTRDNPERPNERIDIFNEKLKKLSSILGVKFFNLNNHFKDGDNKLREEFTDDGLHLTEKAYFNWREKLLEYLDKL